MSLGLFRDRARRAELEANRYRGLLHTGRVTPISGRHRSSRRRRGHWLAVSALTYAAVAFVVRAPSVDEQHRVASGGQCAVRSGSGRTRSALSVLGRHVVTSVLAVLVLAVSLGVQMRWYYTEQLRSTDCEHVELRVLSLNLREGRANMASFTNQARSRAGVVAFSELALDCVQRVYTAGTRDDFPYSVLVPRPGAGGYGLWSRYPLKMIAPLKGGNMVAARVDIHEVEVAPIVASVHF